jgi:hypothetical protein
MNAGRWRARLVRSRVETKDRDPPLVEGAEDTLEMSLVDDVDRHGRLGSAALNHHPLEGPDEARLDLPSDDDVVADTVASFRRGGLLVRHRP